MRRNQWSGVYCFFAWMALVGSVAANESKDRITEVTVFADRAQVTRMVPVDLLSEVQRVTLAGLPPWIDQGSIQVQLVPPQAGEVLQVQTDQETLPGSERAERLQKAETTAKELQKQFELLGDRKSVLEAKETLIAEIQQRVQADSGKGERGLGEVPITYYAELLAFVQEELSKNQKEAREVDEGLAALQPDLNEASRKVDEYRVRQDLSRLRLSVMVRGAKKIQAQLRLTYQLPGASWEPVHEVRLNDSNEIQVVTVAHVTQMTGEDWNDVALSFSTLNPASRKQADRLTPILLGKASAANAARFGSLTKGATWLAAQQRWQQTAAGYGLELFAETPVWEEGIGMQQASAEKALQSFSAMADQDTASFLTAPAFHSVPTQGEVVRVPMSFVSQAVKRWVLLSPSISRAAARAVEFTSPRERPFIPGKALLFVDGAYVGDTQLDYVPSDEPMILFCGATDDVVVTRVLNPELSSLSRSKKQHTLKLAYDIQVKNRTTVMQQVRMAEAVPELDHPAVKLSKLKAAPEGVQAAGSVNWDVDLAPREAKSFSLVYQIDYPSDPTTLEGEHAAEVAQVLRNLESGF